MTSLVTPIYNLQELLEFCVKNEKYVITFDWVDEISVHVLGRKVLRKYIVSQDLTTLISLIIRLVPGTNIINSISCNIDKFDFLPDRVTEVRFQCRYDCVFEDNKPNWSRFAIYSGYLDAPRRLEFDNIKTFLNHCSAQDPKTSRVSFSIKGDNLLEILSGINMTFIRTLMFPDSNDLGALLYFSIFDSNEFKLFYKILNNKE